MREEEKKLAACMRRAAAGEELVIGFLGGSITQGSLSSTPETMYAYLVWKWWADTFPKARMHYVNAGIGGTTSHFGAARAKDDLLCHEPDVVFIDFSVNDDPEPFFQETFEGLLRQLLAWNPELAVLVLNNVFYDTGVNAQEYHNQVAAHYQIPWVSIRDTVYQELQSGKMQRIDISPDGLHPNDRGHALVAGEIIRRLEQIWEEVKKEKSGDVSLHKEMNPAISNTECAPKEAASEDTACAGSGLLPRPLTENAYQGVKRLDITNTRPVLEGFHADWQEKQGHLDFFKNGWLASKKGDRLCVELEGSCIAVQYRKTIHKPTPVARLILDGRQEEAVTLDGNFQEDWGDCLYLQVILHHGAPGKHTVELEITEAGEADQAPFYLLSFLVAP